MLTLFRRNVGIIGLDPPKKEGLIHIPDTMEPERKNQGIIKYIGPDCKLVGLGMHVIFGAYNGSNVKVDNEVLIVMDERFIAAVLDYPTEQLEVPGLYFKNPKGKYFPATYEQAVPLLRASVSHMAALAPKDWQSYQPPTQDYDNFEDDDE